MRTALSAIALGVGLACACQLASSQTVTVTQQGHGNTSSAEQVGLTPYDMTQPMGISATIIQVGDNNHVGDPGASGGGIFQRDNHYQTSAVVEQYGSGNNAGITQDGTSGMIASLDATITQRGARNDATIRQNIVSYSPVTVEQNGIGNVARVIQGPILDGGLNTALIAQLGNDNRALVRQYGLGYVANVTQTGSGNWTSIYQH